MKAANVTFVCRYVGYFSGYDITHPERPQGKILTPGEAKALSDAGISPVSNWEWYANRVLEGHDAGAWDAHVANHIHLACGGPPDRPIYFSVDENLAGAQVATYFQGVASVIGHARTGAYGSDRVLKYLFDNGLISWGWQTYAWSAGAWEPRAHIQQYSNSVNLAGHSVDYNRSIKNDYGQWLGKEQAMRISINTPGIAAEFNQIDAQHWVSRKTGKIIQHAYLESYVGYGNSGKCGLDFLGHPVANEVYYGPKKSRQNYELGVMGWEEGKGCYPLPLYDPNSPGQDPRIVPLQQQVNTLTAQLAQPQTPVIPVDVQAKLDHLTENMKQINLLSVVS